MHPDALLERFKLKSQLKKWRIIALLAVLLFLLTFISPNHNGLGGEGNHIARISIEGVILESPYRDNVIRELAEDSHVKGVILYINSPGGTAAGGEALYEALRILSDAKPTVTVMGSLATSAGYLTALSTNYIFAHKGTLTGSIGVLFQTPNIEKLTDKIGIEMQTIKTDPIKGEPTPFKPIDPDTRQMIQGLLDDFHDVFIDIVASRRKLDMKDARILSDGRVYSGRQALSLKLIDALGTEYDAIKWLQATHGLPKKLDILDVDLEKPKSPFGTFK